MHYNVLAIGGVQRHRHIHSHAFNDSDSVGLCKLEFKLEIVSHTKSIRGCCCAVEGAGRGDRLGDGCPASGNCEEKCTKGEYSVN